jgi:hypothetical protein
VLHLLLLYHGSEFTTDARPNECREIMLLHRYVQLEVWRHLPQETKCSTPPDYASVSCTLLQQTIADQMRECSGSFSLGRTLFIQTAQIILLHTAVSQLSSVWHRLGKSYPPTKVDH